MNIIAFKQVDVFTSKPFLGNPLAVVLDAEGLDTVDMQRIAAWTNLSETTFVLPPQAPQADYRVRIFTPRSELPFAGHPSVGTAHALLEAGRIKARPALVQECAAGLLPVSVEGEGAQRRIFVRAPQARFADSDLMLTHSAGKALGLALRNDPAPRVVTVGLSWLVCDLERAAAVRALAPDMEAVARLCHESGAVGVCVCGRAGNEDFALVVRAFAPGDGVPEDPVTGSANAAIGAYLWATQQLDKIGMRYRASQGREVGRDGIVEVRVDADTGAVDIGGCSVTCVDGTLRVD